MSAEEKTTYQKFKDFLLNNRVIAILLLILGIFYGIYEFVEKVNKVWSLIRDTDYHYALDLADEYYVLVDTLDTEEEAIQLREVLVKISWKYLKLSKVIRFKISLDRV